MLGVWTAGKVPQALGDTICDLANGGNGRGYCEQQTKNNNKHVWFSLALRMLLLAHLFLESGTISMYFLVDLVAFHSAS